MVLRVESQRLVTSNINETVDSVDLGAKTACTHYPDFRKGKSCFSIPYGHCDYCNWDGHTKERFYKLIGFPDHSKNHKPKISFNSNHKPFEYSPRVATHVNTTTTLDLSLCDGEWSSTLETSLTNSFHQEVMKLMKGKLNLLRLRMANHSILILF
ncbi:hypothetical protein JCGZ_22221 [Jatropha curcas]|uniref:Uncharacterized protein n=1 Tax=Jatropha curcas TaxID=180498 RepID=A0A067K1J3_JATCU|nr:hypothetical protein JCGZ_22221 [Jatropha curcas]